MHFCTKPVFNIFVIKPVRQAAQMKRKELKYQGKTGEKESWTTVRTQMLTVAVMQAMQWGIEPWSQQLGTALVHKLYITKTLLCRTSSSYQRVPDKIIYNIWTTLFIATCRSDFHKVIQQTVRITSSSFCLTSKLSSYGFFHTVDRPQL